MIDYNFTAKSKGSLSKLSIKIGIRSHRKINILVVCTSTGRNRTSYEIFDEDRRSMGEREFDDSFFGSVLGIFNSDLCKDLNVLLEEHGEWVNFAKFYPISELAVSMCEGRYGNSNPGADCSRITITSTR